MQAGHRNILLDFSHRMKLDADDDEVESGVKNFVVAKSKKGWAIPVSIRF